MLAVPLNVGVSVVACSEESEERVSFCRGRGKRLPLLTHSCPATEPHTCSTAHGIEWCQLRVSEAFVRDIPWLV